MILSVYCQNKKLVYWYLPKKFQNHFVFMLSYSKRSSTRCSMAVIGIRENLEEYEVIVLPSPTLGEGLGMRWESFPL